MKFASPLGAIQQAGAPETAAKNVTPCVTFGKRVGYIQVCISLSPTSTRSLNLRLRSAMA